MDSTDDRATFLVAGCILVAFLVGFFVIWVWFNRKQQREIDELAKKVFLLEKLLIINPLFQKEDGQTTSAEEVRPQNYQTAR